MDYGKQDVHGGYTVLYRANGSAGKLSKNAIWNGQKSYPWNHKTELLPHVDSLWKDRLRWNIEFYLFSLCSAWACNLPPKSPSLLTETGNFRRTGRSPNRFWPFRRQIRLYPNWHRIRLTRNRTSADPWSCASRWNTPTSAGRKNRITALNWWSTILRTGNSTGPTVRSFTVLPTGRPSPWSNRYPVIRNGFSWKPDCREAPANCKSAMSNWWIGTRKNFIAHRFRYRKISAVNILNGFYPCRNCVEWCPLLYIEAQISRWCGNGMSIFCVGSCVHNLVRVKNMLTCLIVTWIFSTKFWSNVKNLELWLSLIFTVFPEERNSIMV